MDCDISLAGTSGIFVVDSNQLMLWLARSCSCRTWVTSTAQLAYPRTTNSQATISTDEREMRHFRTSASLGQVPMVVKSCRNYNVPRGPIMPVTDVDGEVLSPIGKLLCYKESHHSDEHPSLWCSKQHQQTPNNTNKLWKARGTSHCRLEEAPQP